MINRKACLSGLMFILLIVLSNSVFADETNPLGYKIAEYLQSKGISKDTAIVFISALPIVELRGSIPVAHMMKVDKFRAYILAVFGNMIPVFPIMFLLKPLEKLFSKAAFGRKIFEWFYIRTKTKAKVVEKYEALGLALFVAIPLPVTGAWTGCAAAFLFEINPILSFFAILAGVLVSGLIMTIISSLGWWGFIIAVIALGGLLVKVVFNVLKIKKSEA